MVYHLCMWDDAISCALIGHAPLSGGELTSGLLRLLVPSIIACATPLLPALFTAIAVVVNQG